MGRSERAPDPRQALGKHGEAIAARTIEEAGLRVVERRFRTRRGEIDLVALDGDLVVFVEVKTLAADGWGEPADAVDARKRRRLTRVASEFLARRGWTERRCRFDVVGVRVLPGQGERVVHLVDAFRPAADGPARGRFG